ncbi:RNA-directed DNA polymerase, eukaryota, reverse transcriptase zinc-binding domain protein [Tanacetum coccineum]
MKITLLPLSLSRTSFASNLNGKRIISSLQDIWVERDPWKDPWCGTGSRLKDVFPRLFALESHQDCKVNERWCLVDGVWGGNWEWRLPPRGRALNDLNSLRNVIGNLALSPNCSDKWSWGCDDLGRFNVKSISCIIQNNLLSDCILGDHHTWNSWIPCKVNICVWRASLNRLATRSNLSNRGVPLASSLCPFCESEVEDLDHCLINCPKVLPVWRKIWSWNKVVNADVDSVSSIKEEDIFPSIIRISKSWIGARCTSRLANWNSWIARPFDLFVHS